MQPEFGLHEVGGDHNREDRRRIGDATPGASVWPCRNNGCPLNAFRMGSMELPGHVTDRRKKGPKLRFAVCQHQAAGEFQRQGLLEARRIAPRWRKKAEQLS